MNKNNFLIFLAVAISVSSIAMAWHLRPTRAFGTIPFGGPIKDVTYCCNGIKLTIGEPRGGTFMFIPGQSVPYLYYQQYRAGPWALGRATEGGACVDIGDDCASASPTKGTIEIIGTSLGNAN